MTSIRIESVTKRFGTTLALDRVSLDVKEGEIFFLLGPSGCGKTTLLRIVAGLEMADEGKVLFGERDVTRLPARHREAVMVFQSYALWPHMTVAKNVEFGLDVRRKPRQERRRAVEEALKSVRLGDLAQRKPGQLSGGQQQRVALARALVVKPSVLLLDEPLSNLDAGLRMQMRVEIRRLCSEAGLTALYVTHDQHEAMAVADRIALMRDGQVEQVGTPREIYQKPQSLFAARFMGETNVFEARLVQREPGALELESALGMLTAASLPEGSKGGDEVLCSVRPECLSISASGGDQMSGRVESCTFMGERSEVMVQTGAGTMKVHVGGGTGSTFPVGQEVSLAVAPDCLVVLPRQGEQR